MLNEFEIATNKNFQKQNFYHASVTFFQNVQYDLILEQQPFLTIQTRDFDSMIEKSNIGDCLKHLTKRIFQRI